MTVHTSHMNNCLLINYKNMKNKKIPLLAIGMLAIGAIGSIAYQSFAQTPTTTPAESQIIVSKTNSNQENQNIDQKDAQVNDTEENDGKDVVSVDVLAQVKISEADAIKIALDTNPNTTIKNIVVGDENGKAIYEVKLSNKSEVKIDAVNGTIIKTDQGDNDSNTQSEQNEKDSRQGEVGE